MKISTKVIRLLTNKGFYILLALGIGILGVSGYVANLKKMHDLGGALSVSSTPPKITQPDADIPVISVNAPAVTPPVSTPVRQEAEQVRLILPVQGELGMTFAVNELVYSVTMQDWRTHRGIDIRSDVGTPVKAAAGGVIKSVYTDEMMGSTVVILHANGIETVYANLQSAELVKEDQEVVAGDVIGGVGMTAQNEIGEPPHLHFEVKKDGEYVNPLDHIY